jgi:fucose 4-O-acetylase-like acetyltransferase
MAERTPPYRERHVDFLRAVAITAVVVGHWLAFDVTYDEADGLGGQSVLAVLPWAHPLTWLFQVMPVFFLVGGFANAASLSSRLRRGGDAGSWLLSRTARLLRPTSALLLVLALVALVAWTLGADPEVIGVAAWLASIPLWFLVAYLAAVFLTPPMHALHRRAGLLVPIVLVALVGLGDLARLGLGIPYVGNANFLFAWLAVHQLGFAWQDGRLPARPAVALPMAVGGLVALVLLTVVGPYPVSMVSVPGEPVQNTSPPTLALLALATAQAGIVLLLRDPCARWLQRIRPWTVVVAVNSVIMTMFLWHMSAGIVGVLLLYPTGIMPETETGSPAWLLLRLPWLACLTVILAVLVALFGRIERRSVRIVPEVGRPATVLTVVGAVAVVVGLLGIATAGPVDVPTGLPPVALAAYFAGAALLRLVRHRRHAPDKAVSSPT